MSRVFSFTGNIKNLLGVKVEVDVTVDINIVVINWESLTSTQQNNVVTKLAAAGFQPID